MRTVVVGTRPPELDALIARRAALGLDRHDEVWEGDHHMAPAARPSHGYLQAELIALLRPLAKSRRLVVTAEFNLGTPDDFRVPDLGVHRALPTATFVPTAGIAVEVVSPGDETWDKLGFYAAHGVDELLVVDGEERRAIWLALAGASYEEADGSRVLGVTGEVLTAGIDWPWLGDA